MKLIAIIFLLTMLVNTCYYGIYEALVIQAKYRSGQAIELLENQHRLQLVKIPVQAAQQYNSNEIWYQHQLYDVANRKTIGDTVYFYLYHDQEEQNILSKLDNLLRSEDNTLIPSSEKIIHFKHIGKIQDQSYPYSARLPLQRTDFYATQFISAGDGDLDTSMAEVPTPPPKMILSFRC